MGVPLSSCFVVDGEARINQLELQTPSVSACSVFTAMAGNENVLLVATASPYLMSAHGLEKRTRDALALLLQHKQGFYFLRMVVT
jgi:hypothetical protein